MRDDLAAGANKRLRSPGGRTRTIVKNCDIPGCAERAEPREPYCLGHLEELGYAAET